MTADRQARSSIAIGLFWMMVCLTSFIGMAVASRELSETLSVFQILFFRSLIGLLIVLCFIKILLPELLEFRQIRFNLLRNFVHFGAQYCWTVGVILLPLAQVFALEFTVPIWVALFAFLFLREKASFSRAIAIFGSFLGIIIILRPGATGFDYASFVVILAAIGYAISIVIVKHLTLSNSPAVIVAWMVVMQLPMGFGLALLDWRSPQLDNIPWIFIVGITGLSAHYAMAKALKSLDASAVIPIDFFRVPLIAIVGFYLYGERLDVWLLVGAALIFISNFYMYRKEISG